VALEPSFQAWIDDWALTGDGDAGDALAELGVTGRGEDFAYALRATTDLAPVLQGEAGFSVKSEGGQASYYYSQPFYEVEGTLTVGGREGRGHRDGLARPGVVEPAARGGPGGLGLVLAASRRRGAGDGVPAARGEGGAFHSGTWIAADGTATLLSPGQIRLTPRGEAEVAGRRVPVEWRLEIPDFGLAVDTEPVNAQSWMGTAFPYWEGPIRVSGSHEGRGYLEMTGY
jgi:predicted secreted hydrolase